MADRMEIISVLIAVEFVLMAAVVLVLVPIEAAAPLFPLALVFTVALYMYLS